MEVALGVGLPIIKLRLASGGNRRKELSAFVMQ